jgi:ketopantoate reductase
LIIENNIPSTEINVEITDASVIDSLDRIGNQFNIVIAGAGSIGTVLGVLLSQDGHEVTLIRKRDPFGSIAIEVVGEESFTHTMDIIDSKVRREEIDKLTPHIVFLASQRQQLLAQLEDLPNAISFTNDPIIIPLQNGLGTAQLVCNWIENNGLDLPLLQAIVWWSATLHEYDLVLYHSKAVTTLGIPEKTRCQSATQKDLKLITNLLSSVLEVKNVDIDQEPYVKLILNVISPVLALVKQPYPTGVNDLNIRKVIRLLFEEVIEIGKKEGWYQNDRRLEGFYEILKGTEKLEHYSMRYSLPKHKVSSQISAEKYGGKGSNVSELLGYFVSKGASLCSKLLDLFLTLEPNYEAITSSKLLKILKL